MGMTAVKLKIMPDSLEVNLHELKESVKEKLEEIGGVVNSIEEEPVAFGLKALIVTIAWPEEKDTQILENLKLEKISSSKIIDYRRAMG